MSTAPPEQSQDQSPGLMDSLDDILGSWPREGSSGPTGEDTYPPNVVRQGEDAMFRDMGDVQRDGILPHDHFLVERMRLLAEPE